MTSNALGIGFGPKYYINDRININIGCGVGYNLINWENTAQNTSGKFNVILPSLNSGVSLDIHQSPTHHPFPMRVLFYFGITCVYPPTTFEIDTDGIEKLDDWQKEVISIVNKKESCIVKAPTSNIFKTTK